MSKIEIKIKVKTDAVNNIKEIVNLIREIEKEYSCCCTLLEIEVI